LYAVTFTYKVDGHYYGGEFKTEVPSGYAEGAPIAVRYNPAKPEENDLDGGGKWAIGSYVIYCVAIAAIVIYALRGCH